MTSRDLLASAGMIALLAALSLLSVLSALAALRNFRNFREYRRVPPLAHVQDDRILMSVQAEGLPRRWPDPTDTGASGELRSAVRCRAYARLAEERAVDREALGEVLLLFAGAMFGFLVSQVLGDRDALSTVQGQVQLGVAAAAAASGLRTRLVTGPRYRRWADAYMRAAARFASAAPAAPAVPAAAETHSWRMLASRSHAVRIGMAAAALASFASGLVLGGRQRRLARRARSGQDR